MFLSLMKKEKNEIELREAVIKNYLARWAGRFGVPGSHGIRFKLTEKQNHGNTIVYSYEIFLVKHSGIAQISLTDFIWEGHLDQNDAERIFFHLLENEILIRRQRAYYFNLTFIDNIRTKLRPLLLELDKQGLVSRMVSKFSFKHAGKLRHPGTVSYIVDILENSINKIDKTTLKITYLGGSNFGKSSVFRLLETAGSYNVVKVDNQPVSWKQYSNDLKNQRAVAKNLGPEIQTMVPGISFALSGNKYLWANPKYQYVLSYQGNLSVQEQDLLFGDKLVRIADNDKNLREFLKIKDRYGYFMPYLEEGILVDILDDIHGYKEIPGSSMVRIERDAAEEMAADFHLMEQADFDFLNKKYLNIDRELLELIRSLFLRKKFDSAEQFIEELKKIKTKDNKTTVHKSYADNIRKYLRDLYLGSTRTRNNLAHIIAGLLKLYAILRQKEIAIRDLKAGNIFLTDDIITNGDLGLLDFETAIKYATPYPTSKIPQPRMGGTPSRGTPSLWFSNEVLLAYYGELARPIYLPDLYAIIDVIYSAVTREPLLKKGKEIIQHIFEVINGDLELDCFKTKLSLPSLSSGETTYVLERTVVSIDSDETKLDEAGQGEDSPEYMPDVYKIVNNIYWESVFPEFQEALARHKYLLKQIEISLPPEFVETLKEEIKYNCRLLENQLQQPGNFQEKRQKELERQQKSLQDSLETLTVYKLLKLLFETVALFMNRIS